MFCSICYSLEHPSSNCSHKAQTNDELEQEIVKIYDLVSAVIKGSSLGNSEDEYGRYFSRTAKKIKKTNLSEELQPPRFIFTKEIEEKFTPVLNKSVEILRSSPEEIHQRLWTTMKNVKLISSMNKKVICFPQGSLHTKTFLPSSDIDLVVFNSTIQDTYDFLAVMKDHVKDIQQIDAIVPIIKYYDAETNFQVDISFDNSSGYGNGVRCNKCIEKHPILQPLNILLKKIFSFYDCADTYTGGINSTEVFQLSLMFVRLSPNQTLFQYLVNILNFLENIENFNQKEFHPVKLIVTKPKKIPKKRLYIIDSKDERIILGKSSRKVLEFTEHAKSVLQMIEKCDSEAFLKIINEERYEIVSEQNPTTNEETVSTRSDGSDSIFPMNLENSTISQNPENVMISQNPENVIIPQNPENAGISQMNKNTEVKKKKKGRTRELKKEKRNKKYQEAQKSLLDILNNNQDNEHYFYTVLRPHTFRYLFQNKAAFEIHKTTKYHYVKLQKSQLQKINLSDLIFDHKIYNNFSDFKKRFPVLENINDI